LLLEGAQGVGRSRLLREAALVAQLGGAVVLRAEGTGQGENFAVCTDLVRMLLHSAPELANAPDPAIRSRLAHLLPELANLPARASEDAVERRLWLHSALILYFSEVTRRAPLAIVIDDVHRADEPSLAVLVALARVAQRSKLALLLTALSSSSEASAESPTLSALKSSAESIRLHRLGPGQTTDLVHGLFGDAPRVDRLAAWLYERTHGYPQQCVELCQHFVEQGIIKFWR
jgi:predicted ATPase